MPIYEYVCERCGAHLEVLQKMTDKPLRRCKSCGGRLEKIISQTSFILKGSGWYVTDYARKERREKESKSSEGDGKASKSEE
ncbi:MAG: zinc ribbon domain-containing protein [Blastocatellia bacterium]|nr:zinc ribbon domain-containing protein [Blastocatellia bacterium]MCS7158382.1 zinc ribbon domain-containing protein [Blastocatellia bacterium]MCX7752888.1 zinc ribbon domain-containing protein [Blastocatellia bacterium]MDW8167944.1 FmdB family zinc ribbon protein [Acidobacteriota bacterium]MDW8255969.1 FmdB family zinc ribbon protein [Acidobacteriota bacterium]